MIDPVQSARGAISPPGTGRYRPELDSPFQTSLFPSGKNGAPPPGVALPPGTEPVPGTSAVYSHRPGTYALTVRKTGFGGTGVHGAVQVFTYINRVAYIALGVVVFLTWYRRRDRASLWAAAAFGSLALLEILSFIPNHPGNLAERATGRVAILLFVVFPYLLYRFTNEFRATGRRLANLLFLVTAVLIVWTVALPKIPQAGEALSPGFQAFVILFLVHWTLLSIVAATS